MNRFLGAVMMVLVGCAGSDSARCTRDSQCPRDAFCDRDTGVCFREEVMPNGGGTGGSGGSLGPIGGSGGASGGSSTAAQNRAALPCKSDSECPGGKCEGLNASLATGYCFNECGTSSAPNQAMCRLGTTCVGFASVGKAACVQYCTADSECSVGMKCFPNLNDEHAGKSSCQPFTPSIAGGPCRANSECAAPLKCDTSVPGGYCTARCGPGGITCPSLSVCVQFTDDDSFCMQVCHNVGSACFRTEQKCRALQGLNYGFCG